MNTLRDAALKYAARGWPVFPLHTPVSGCCSCSHPHCGKTTGKHPRTLHGLKDATTSEPLIREWWEKWSESNVAILTGSASGIVVLDVDPDKGGEDSLAALEGTHGPLPETVETVTGGGGRHFFFTHPGRNIKSSAGTLGPGLDVRADGGYIVAPPSLHLSGRTYTWRKGHAPGELAMASPPDWLLKELTEPQHGQGANTQAGEKIPEGTRNTTLTSLAGSMRHRGMSQEAILTALLAENTARCQPPLPKDEVKRIVKSVMRYPTQLANWEQQLQTGGKTGITWVPSELESIVRKLQSRVLSEPDKNTEPILSHGGRLVTVRKDTPKSVRQVKKSAEEGYPPMYLIKSYESEQLRMRVMRDAAFLNAKGHEIALPDMALRAFSQASVEHAAPLVAIVEHPVITPDGRLISGTGYDPATGLYMTVSPTIVPRFDRALEWIDACCSLDWLRSQYLAEYPFSTPCDRDAAIALSLTLLERAFIAGPNGFPGFSSTAPTQSSGKTTLFNQASHAVLGRAAAATSWTSNSEEMAKTIVALVLEGHSFVLFDNLPEGKPFSSDEVAKLLTSEEYSGRQLGVNKIVKAAANVFVGFTGNNITPADDFASRVLQIELKPDTENPDRRKFVRPDIIEWTSARRAEILFHLCVLPAAYLRSGDRISAIPTRFTLWDQLVRFPILWADGNDVADLFERNRVEDPHRQANVTFLSAWMTCFGSSLQQVKDVLEELEKHREDSGWPEFHQSIESLLGNVALTSQSLAGLLKRLENKIIDGLRLEHAPGDDDSRGTRRPRPWCVRRTGS